MKNVSVYLRLTIKNGIWYKIARDEAPQKLYDFRGMVQMDTSLERTIQQRIKK